MLFALRIVSTVFDTSTKSSVVDSTGTDASKSSVSRSYLFNRVVNDIITPFCNDGKRYIADHSQSLDLLQLVDSITVAM